MFAVIIQWNFPILMIGKLNPREIGFFVICQLVTLKLVQCSTAVAWSF